MPKKRTVRHRIPWHSWINSPLSVIRHYGAGIINGRRYEFDPEMMKTPNAQGKYEPDLVTYQKARG